MMYKDSNGTRVLSSNGIALDLGGQTLGELQVQENLDVNVLNKVPDKPVNCAGECILSCSL